MRTALINRKKICQMYVTTNLYLSIGREPMLLPVLLCIGLFLNLYDSSLNCLLNDSSFMEIYLYIIYLYIYQLFRYNLRSVVVSQNMSCYSEKSLFSHYLTIIPLRLEGTLSQTFQEKSLPIDHFLQNQ